MTILAQSRIGAALLLLSWSCISAGAASKAANYLLSEQIVAACEGRGGTIDPSAFIERDLTGDGRADLLISHEGITCRSGLRRSLECGVQVCSVRIYVREGSLLRLREEFLGMQLSVGNGPVPVIRALGHGGGEGFLRWNGRSFARVSGATARGNATAIVPNARWTSGFGQGIHEARILNGPGNVVTVNCDFASGFGSSLVIEVQGVRPPAGSEVEMWFDGKPAETVLIDGDGEITADSHAGAANLRLVLQRMKRHRIVTIRLAGGQASSFSLRGSSRAIGDCPIVAGNRRSSTDADKPAPAGKTLALPGADNSSNAIRTPPRAKFKLKLPKVDP